LKATLVAPNYYAIFCVQTYIKVGVVPPMIGAHIMEWEFFAMWTIKDLEFCECMFYSLTCGYSSTTHDAMDDWKMKKIIQVCMPYVIIEN
jgi:hypothetical protein